MKLTPVPYPRPMVLMPKVKFIFLTVLKVVYVFDSVYVEGKNGHKSILTTSQLVLPVVDGLAKTFRLHDVRIIDTTVTEADRTRMIRAFSIALLPVEVI